MGLSAKAPHVDDVRVCARHHWCSIGVQALASPPARCSGMSDPLPQVRVGAQAACRAASVLAAATARAASSRAYTLYSAIHSPSVNQQLPCGCCCVRERSVFIQDMAVLDTTGKGNNTRRSLCLGHGCSRHHGEG